MEFLNVEPAEKSVWLQLDDEPDRMFVMFIRYALMAQKRSYKAVSDVFGLCINTVYNYSKKYNWKSRAEAFDLSLTKNLTNYLTETVNEYNNEKIDQKIKVSAAIQSITENLIDYAIFPNEYWDNDTVKKKVSFYYNVASKLSKLIKLADFSVSSISKDASMGQMEIANLMRVPHDPYYLIDHLPPDLKKIFSKFVRERELEKSQEMADEY